MQGLRIWVAVLGILGFGALLFNLALKAPSCEQFTDRRFPSSRPLNPSPADSKPLPGELKRIVVGGGPIYSVAFSSDGQRLATGGADRIVRIWNVHTGELIHALAGHDSAVTSVAFSPDGQSLASAGGLRERGLFLWDAASGSPRSSLQPVDGWVSAVRFSSNGRYLLAATGTGSRGKDFVAWWDLTTGKFLLGPDGRDLVYRNNDGISSLAISTNRRYVLATNFALRVWNTRTHEERLDFAAEKENPLFIRQAIFTREGRGILAGGLNGVLGLWDVDTGEELRRFKGHTHEITSLSVSADDTLAVSSALDGTIRLWDIATARELRGIATDPGAVCAVEMSPVEPFFASGGKDGVIRLWSTAEYQRRKFLCDDDARHTQLDSADCP